MSVINKLINELLASGRAAVGAAVNDSIAKAAETSIEEALKDLPAQVRGFIGRP